MKLTSLAIFLVLLSLNIAAQDWSRAQIYSALQTTKVLDANRELVHFSHTCTLRIEGREYPVVDLRELVKGVSTPRGVNRIVIFDSSLHPVQEIDYTTQRPLFCLDNRLYVYGDLEIGNVQPEGDVLTFTNKARDIKLTHVDANNYPIPITRERKSPPQ